MVLLCTSHCIHVSARPPKLDTLTELHGRGKVLLVLLLQVGVLKTHSLALLL